MKKNKLLILLLILISLGISLILLYYDSEIGTLFLLPLSYSILTFILLCVIKNRDIFSSFIFILTLVVLFFRYCLAPYFSIFNDLYVEFGPDPLVSTYFEAIVIMILELFFCYLITFLISQHNKFIVESEKCSLLKRKKILLLLVVPMTLILFVMYPSLFKFSVNLDINNFSDETTDYGIISVIFSHLKILVWLVILSYLSRLNEKKHKKIYVLIAFIISIILLASFIDTSRWTVIIMLILILFVLKRLFGKFSKSLVTVTLIFGAIAFIGISVYKNSYTLQGSDNLLLDTMNTMTMQIDYYFSGVRNVAQSLEMQREFDYLITYKTFLNDLFGGIPYLNKFFSQYDRVNIYFNEYNGFSMHRASLIIPMSGIGISYFPYFPYLLTILFTFIAYKLYFLSLKETKLEFKFIYMYAAVYCALQWCLNTQSISFSLLVRVLPVFLLLKLNDYFSSRRG